MKKFAICLLVITLLVPGALAATTRETQSHALSDAELIQIRPLVDAFAYAATLKGVPSLAPGEAPPQALIEGVFLRALERGALMTNGERPANVTLTGAQLADMFRQAFTHGQYPGIQAPMCPCITASGDGLAFDLSDADTVYVGAHVYASEETQGGVTLHCDLYSMDDYDAMPDDVPDEALVWLSGAEFALARDEQAPYGFTVSGYAIGQAYQAQALYPYENEALGFELFIPDIFMSNLTESETGFTAQAPDGAASLAFTCTNEPSAMDVAEYAASLQAAGYTVETHEEWSFLVWRGEGESGMRYILEDMTAQYVMSYPPERALEFTLYAEFMNNSFNLTELSVG